MPLSQIQILAFNAINDFVTDLGKFFVGKQHSLDLYARLIHHTVISNEQAIGKFVDGFSKYIISNQQAIENSDEVKLNDETIVYSPGKVFINMKHVFHLADSETKTVIWKHFLTIYAILFPDSQARELLKKLNQVSSTDNMNETELIQTMMQKIIPHLADADTSNPLTAIAGLMSSGVLPELISTMEKSMNNGTLNINNLLGTASQLFASSPSVVKDTKLIDEKK